MHEITIADKILREARKTGAHNFFRVEIGELCEITKEELENGLKQLTTPLLAENFTKFGASVLQKSGEIIELDEQTMNFIVDFIESEIKCKCGFIGRAKIIDRGHGYCIWNCPCCGAGSGEIEILRGGEIKIIEVE